MVLRGRIGALRKWSREPDRAAATAPARAAFMARWEHEVDPDEKLTPEKRSELAECARRAYFAQLARRSAIARAKKAPAVTTANAQEVDRATDHTTARAA